MEGNQEEFFRIRKPRHGEILGVVESLMGAGKMRVRCQDDKIRLCRIPGKMRKRSWIRDGDIVLVKPWDIQGDEKGDIVYIYKKAQAMWLKRNGILKLDF